MIVRTIINVLKCLSIISLIGSPKNLISNPIITNLPPLPKMDATINTGRFIWKTPAVIENTFDKKRNGKTVISVVPKN